jgi:hypothetical protein
VADAPLDFPEVTLTLAASAEDNAWTKEGTSFAQPNERPHGVRRRSTTLSSSLKLCRNPYMEDNFLHFFLWKNYEENLVFRDKVVAFSFNSFHKLLKIRWVRHLRRKYFALLSRRPWDEIYYKLD